MKAVMMTVGASFVLLAGAGAQNAELDVLKKYVGKWEATFTIGDGGEEMKAEVLARWVLGKSFVQQTSTLQDESGEESFGIMTLMTYDGDAGKYRKWTFTSDGNATEETGTWDAESKTLRWTGEDPKNGSRMTVSATFKGNDEEHWSIVTEDAAGGVTSRITGVNRRKE